MIPYQGQPLTLDDAMIVHEAEWSVYRRLPFWHFDPANPDLVWLQTYYSTLDGIEPPRPNIAYRSWWEGEMVDLPPTAIVRLNQPSPHFHKSDVWPWSLDLDGVKAQHAALRGWIRQNQPWRLPDDYVAAWRPLMAVLAREEEARRERRTQRQSFAPDTRDLVEIISETVELTKRGARWIGMCPFHKDRTPSLSVHPEKGWFCFGCGSGGKAGTWLQKVRGM